MGMEGMRFETNPAADKHEPGVEHMDSKAIEGVAFSHSSVWNRILNGALEKILQQSGIDTSNKGLILERMESMVLEKFRANPSELQLLTLPWTNSLDQAQHENIDRVESRMENDLAKTIEALFVKEKSDLIRMATEEAPERLH